MSGNPLTDLTAAEGEVKRGGKHVLYCDACGKPWMECAERVQLALLTSASKGRTVDEVKAAFRVCPGGHPTVGHGHNLDARGFSDAVILADDLEQIAEDVRLCIAAVGIECWNAMYLTRPWLMREEVWIRCAREADWAWFTLRHRALLELAHWLGGFSGFPGFVRAVQAQDWPLAVDELIWVNAATKAKHTELWLAREQAAGMGVRLDRICRWIATGTE